MEVRVSTDPVKLPLTVLQARQHLQIEHSDDDSYIKALIKAATNLAEIKTHRKFITQTITLDLDAFDVASPIRLPYPVFQSLTTFSYYDGDRTKTTVPSTNYDVVGTNPARIVGKEGGFLTQQTYLSHEVVYVTGYGLSGENVPQDIIHAIKIIIADLWNHPESSKPEARNQPFVNQLPYAAEAILQSYRVLI